jgi:hypothetical protein
MTTAIFRFRLTDRPDAWLTMIDPACTTLDAARETLAFLFSDRLLEVVAV